MIVKSKDVVVKEIVLVFAAVLILLVHGNTYKTGLIYTGQSSIHTLCCQYDSAVCQEGFF